jgi:predicted SnoaL-like aldol condensation-catalyzing enzyme
MTRNHIEQTLNIIYDKVFHLGQSDLSPDLVGDIYIQHNPQVSDGVEDS